MWLESFHDLGAKRLETMGRRWLIYPIQAFCKKKSWNIDVWYPEYVPVDLFHIRTLYAFKIKIGDI